MKSYFESILEDTQIISDKNSLSTYGIDRTGHYESNAALVLLPRTTSDLSSILKICNDHQIKVIPSGGRTGLSGSATALNGEVVISMEKMNSIIGIDQVGSTITVEAGAILENVQESVKQSGMYFPLDFAAKGSCQIGGCLSTNAGGVKVLRYGMTRDIVLGIEVILATGDILDLNKKLIKDNSGYKLEQLFIGAEGTLGIITKATFKCVSAPKHLKLAYLGIQNFDQITTVFEQTKKSGFELTAFEFVTDIGVKSVLKAMPQINQILNELYPYQVLIEINHENLDEFENFLISLNEQGLICDAIIATNSNQYKNIWTIREAVSDSLYLLGTVHANDISVPIKSLSQFLSKLNILLSAKYQEFTLGLFGHIGDGNLHIYIINENKNDLFDKSCKLLDEEMFKLVQSFSGSISAEHGIGLLKKDALHFRRSDLEIDLMKQIKSVFDPNNILNPGKIF